jgi:hypothetical protein
MASALPPPSKLRWPSDAGRFQGDTFMSIQNRSDDLEKVYDTLATSVDKAATKSELFLAKLALLLAHDVADPKRVATLCEAALADL